jgi:hypothetical protein
MRPGGASPETARNRAARAELCLVELRDADGRRVPRDVTVEEARRLIADGAAVREGRGKRAFLRLRAVLPPDSNRPLHGQAATRPSNPAATYHHNYAACMRWRSLPVPVRSETEREARRRKQELQPS